MALRHLGIVLIGVAIGFAMWPLIPRESDSDSAESTLGANGTKGAAPYSDNAALAILERENESLRAELAGRAGSAPIAPGTLEASEVLAERRKKQEQRETQALLAEGFSAARIEWLRRRSQELEIQQQQRREETEHRLKRQPVNTDEMTDYMSHLYNPDLDLRYEIGDDEYERYLRGRGLPTGIAVTELAAGSLAEVVGVKSGDEIVAYGNKRVLNIEELNKLTRAADNPGSNSLSVKRNGELVRLIVPKGSLGIRAPFVPIPGASGNQVLSAPDIDRLVEIAGEFSKMRFPTPQPAK